MQESLRTCRGWELMGQMIELLIPKEIIPPNKMLRAYQKTSCFVPNAVDKQAFTKQISVWQEEGGKE